MAEDIALNPIQFPEAYDYFILAGEPSPGLCVEVGGASNPRKWDEKEGNQQSGATLVYGGDKLGAWTVKLELWTVQHFADWAEWKRLLIPPTEKKPKALTCFHPHLEELPVPVRECVIIEPASPKLIRDGVWGVEIKCKQYRPPKPAGAKASGSKSTVANEKGGGDDVDALINNLKGQTNALANG